MALDFTHDPAATSWLDAAQAPGADFPIQNLPFGVFRRQGRGDEAWRGGVAIGDQVLDLGAAADALPGAARNAARACAQSTLNEFFALGPTAWRALRHALFKALQRDANAATAAALRAALLPQAAVEHALPARIGDYSDFYTSLAHAENVGRLFTPPLPVAANFHWLPIAYHGRASSIGVSGQQFHRPMGQAMAPGARAPAYGPCARLDFELELGIFIGQGNALGRRIPLARAEEHVFGICLLNDWSARDIQFWEMAPLGPFLGKNFATTISPWIVTLDALEPYRLPWKRAAELPQPLPYLDAPGHRERGAIDIQLEAALDTARRRDAGLPPARLSRTSFRHQHWSVAQMVAQHTVGGCNLQTGDLLGSGTISGPGADEAGAMIELSQGGARPLRLADSGEERGFLHDGDTVVLRGWCEKAGAARIGFGECRGTVLPALE